jgi:hypothetical protein
MVATCSTRILHVLPAFRHLLYSCGIRDRPSLTSRLTVDAELSGGQIKQILRHRVSPAQMQRLQGLGFACDG